MIGMGIITVSWIKSANESSYFSFAIFGRIFMDLYFLYTKQLKFRADNEQRRLAVLSIGQFLAGVDVVQVVTKEDAQIKNYYSVFL